MEHCNNAPNAPPKSNGERHINLIVGYKSFNGHRFDGKHTRDDNGKISVSCASCGETSPYLPENSVVQWLRDHAADTPVSGGTGNIHYKNFKLRSGGPFYGRSWQLARRR